MTGFDLDTPVGRRAIETAIHAVYYAYPSRGPDGVARTYKEAYGCAPGENADDLAEAAVAIQAALDVLLPEIRAEVIAGVIEHIERQERER